MGTDNIKLAEPCNLCGGTNARFVHEDVVEGYFNRRIVECLECGLAFVNPQPTPEQLQRFYDDRYFMDAENSSDEDIAAHTETASVAYRVERRLPIIKKIRPGGHLLDIGANDGTFLKHAIEHGFEATGIELAPAMARFASRYAHTEVWGGSTDSFIENHHDRTFDIASLWDVIEHFLDPLAELKKINGLLNPGGLLAISTVNRGSLRGKMYGDRWLGFFEGQEHTFFFTPEVMCRYMQSAGFRVVKVLGWNTPPLLLRFVDLFKLGNILEVYAVKE